MKKTLLYLGIAILSFSANAQLTTSFEASEGFTTGNVNGQGDWVTSSYQETANGPVLYIENQVVSDEQASDGTMSLKIDIEPDFPGQSDTAVGATLLHSESGQFQISFDVFPASQVSGGSDYAISLNMGNALVARVAFGFFFEGDAQNDPIDPFIKVVDLGEDENGDLQLMYVPTEMLWEPETWYNVKIVVDETNDTIEYFIDGESIYQSAPIASEFDSIAFGTDNWDGSMFIDNLVIDNDLSVAQNNVAKFAVAPNPASSVLNIGNPNNALIESVEIADINGRIVKSLKGNLTNQINVSDLSAGAYMMTINSDKGSVTKKIVKN